MHRRSQTRKSRFAQLSRLVVFRFLLHCSHPFLQMTHFSTDRCYIVLTFCTATHTHTHTHLTALFPGLPRWSQYQNGKTSLDFSEARDSEWQWHQLGHMQVCTSLQADNHASTEPLSILQAVCPFCHPSNSVKALKATSKHSNLKINFFIR